MGKKDRIELYRLIEPKFKEKFINGIEPNAEDFKKYGLSIKHLQEFMDLYLGHWNHSLIWEDKLEIESVDMIKMPSDEAFFNFGIQNIVFISFS